MKNTPTQASSVTRPVSLKMDDRPIRNIGLFILFLTFGLFGVWSFTAPIASSAAAPGFVMVKSHRKSIQHLEGGIVSELLVKDGDIVKTGQPLLILDDTQARAEREMMRNQYITLTARLARLLAEKDHLDKVKYPKELDNEDDFRIKDAKRSETEVFIARKNAYDGEISLLKQRITALDARMKGFRGQIQSKKELTASFSEEIGDLKELLEEGFADKLRLRELQRQKARTRGEISQLQSNIATSKMQQGETRLQILQMQKKFQEEVINTLAETRATLHEISEKLTAAEDRFKRKIVHAPTDGVVMGLSIHTVGGVIQPGDTILDIVPQNTELTVTVEVSPIDIDRVTTGLTAEIRFAAFKQARMPIMEGTVINVSGDSFINEKTGGTYYKATIEITPESLAKLDEVNFQLVPGMPADVLIQTGERTFFEYLAEPITNAFAHAFIDD